MLLSWSMQNHSQGIDSNKFNASHFAFYILFIYLNINLIKYENKNISYIKCFWRSALLLNDRIIQGWIDANDTLIALHLIIQLLNEEFTQILSYFIQYFFVDFSHWVIMISHFVM